MKYLFGNIKLNLAALTITLIGLLIYYLSYNEINTDHEIVDQSYLDGSELDRAEQSLSFEYNENIIEYNSDDDFIMEALELLDPQSPTSQTYGIYEKQPTLKEYVMLDDNFIIIDEDLNQNFYIVQIWYLCR